MSAEIDHITTAARKRYETDAQAHALVEMTVQILNVQNHNAMGQSMSRSEQTIARWAAAMAIHLGTLDPATGYPFQEQAAPPPDIDRQPITGLS